MNPGIVLIHGYTGSSLDFKPLADGLSACYGGDSVKNIMLPGHGGINIPPFDEDLFVDAIANPINTFVKEKRKLIVIGHSTGGNLALCTITRFSIIPDLLVLISSPKKIDKDYFERWILHRAGKGNVPLTDMAMMVKLVNSTGSGGLSSRFPVLIIHGDNDSLVPGTDSMAWKNELSPARTVFIPGAGHNIIGENNKQALDIIHRAVEDVLEKENKIDKIVDLLIEIDPGLKNFFIFSPMSESHISRSPGAQRAAGVKPALPPFAKNDPAIANIEITTNCNLKCRYCARTQLKKRAQNMPFDRFRNILDLLPNSYKITLVGLGEPLMHPLIFDFIKYAGSLNKSTGIVTNAMLLDRDVSIKLLEAGLDSITFSIDGFDERTSSLVRKGSDFNRIIRNIGDFVEVSRSVRKIPMAVFSAVSINTVEFLKNIVDRVSRLGADVLMLSDINFKDNVKDSLWRNADDRIEETVNNAVSYAFSKRLPVLSVHGLEEFGLEKRYYDFLLLPPAQLYRRSCEHTWCLSPWQTIPVDADGNVTLCDCRPDLVLGNLLKDHFEGIWNGEIIKRYRSLMTGRTPPEGCRICPRF